MNKTELPTARLRLRLLNISDLRAVHNLHSLPETDEFNTLGIPKSIAETKSVIELWHLENQRSAINNYTFVIEKNDTNQFVGLIALKLRNRKFRCAEVWYKLHSAFWGKGFGTEAVNRLLDFGFNQLNLHRIEAGCAIGNMRSIKVLEKVGMIREGTKRQILPLKSGWTDCFEYAIIETDKRVFASIKA